MNRSIAGWTNKPIVAASIYNQEQPEGQQDFIGHYLRTFHRLIGYESRTFAPFAPRNVNVKSRPKYPSQGNEFGFCTWTGGAIADCGQFDLIRK